MISGFQGTPGGLDQVHIKAGSGATMRLRQRPLRADADGYSLVLNYHMLDD